MSARTLRVKRNITTYSILDVGPPPPWASGHRPAALPFEPTLNSPHGPAGVIAVGAARWMWMGAGENRRVARLPKSTGFSLLLKRSFRSATTNSSIGDKVVTRA